MWSVTCAISKIELGGSGPLLCMAGMSPLFYSFILHTYIRYTLRYFVFSFYNWLYHADMKWVTLTLNPPHSLNNHTDLLFCIMKNCKYPLHLSESSQGFWSHN